MARANQETVTTRKNGMTEHEELLMLRVLAAKQAAGTGSK